jgi:hypothetical protein
MVIHRKDAKGEAEFPRMFSEHSRRRTGATDFVAPRAAIQLLVLYRGEPRSGERADRESALDFVAKQGQYSDKVRMSRAHG